VLFKKALASSHVSSPRVITVDKNPAYPVAIQELQAEKSMPSGTQIRQQKYLNHIIEQDHPFIKKRVHSMLGLKSFRTAKKILSGMEAMHMLRKKQVFLSKTRKNLYISCLDLQHKVGFSKEVYLFFQTFIVFAPEPAIQMTDC
jgi:transposase-like protein